jgi:hypothetical protein
LGAIVGANGGCQKQGLGVIKSWARRETYRSMGCTLQSL